MCALPQLLPCALTIGKHSGVVTLEQPINQGLHTVWVQPCGIVTTTTAVHIVVGESVCTYSDLQHPASTPGVS